MESNRKLVHILGGVTMLGYGGGRYPRDRGNCFSIGNEKPTPEWFRIVNMNYENFAKLVKDRVLTFPIEIEMIDERRAKMVDKRVPPDWISRHWCRVCCPERLIPDEFKWKPAEKS